MTQTQITPHILAGISRSWEGVLCGMRNFEKVYFAEFHLRNT